MYCWCRLTCTMNCAGVPFLDGAAEQITRKVEQFSPQDATNAVWAFARLFHYPDQAFLKVRLLYKSSRRHIFVDQCSTPSASRHEQLFLPDPLPSAASCVRVGVACITMPILAKC